MLLKILIINKKLMQLIYINVFLIHLAKLLIKLLTYRQ